MPGPVPGPRTWDRGLDQAPKDQAPGPLSLIACTVRTSRGHIRRSGRTRGEQGIFRADWQMPEKSGLPSGSRGASPVRFGLPSAVRGTPPVGWCSHCPEVSVPPARQGNGDREDRSGAPGRLDRLECLIVCQVFPRARCLARTECGQSDVGHCVTASKRTTSPPGRP